MRRLAMAAAFGVVVALALAGTAASGAARSPSLIASPSPTAARSAGVVPGVVRARVTTLDAARASVPLPRTSTTTTTVSADRPAATARASRSAARPRAITDATWAALARCESSGDAGASSDSGRYSGAFQFSDATWHSLGHDGRAADHPYEVQLAAAKRLQARSGWSQWPRCARRLGLR